MKVKLGVYYRDTVPEYFIMLPSNLVHELGWTLGEELVVDIPVAYPDQITIHLENDNDG